MEQVLQESEQRFRVLTEALPQLVWTAQPNGELDYVNQRVLDYFDRPSSEIVGWNWKGVLYPDDLDRCLLIWKTALETGNPYEIELRLKRASDGNHRWHLGRALPLRDHLGRIVKWFGTFTDIHEIRWQKSLFGKARSNFER